MNRPVSSFIAFTKRFNTRSHRVTYGMMALACTIAALWAAYLGSVLHAAPEAVVALGYWNISLKCEQS